MVIHNPWPKRQLKRTRHGTPIPPKPSLREMRSAVQPPAPPVALVQSAKPASPHAPRSSGPISNVPTGGPGGLAFRETGGVEKKVVDKDDTKE